MEEKSEKELIEKFQEKDYLPKMGELGEKRLFAVNHICIHEDCVIFNDLVLPYGASLIEEKTTFIIDEILYHIVHLINKEENKEKVITICGSPKAKRMLGRKLEDRLKREVLYEEY